MTVTNIYREALDEKMAEVERALLRAGMEKEDNLFVSPNGKIKLSLYTNDFPKYTRNSGYESDYVNFYIMPLFV